MFSEAYGPIDEEHIKPTFVLNHFFFIDIEGQMHDK